MNETLGWLALLAAGAFVCLLGLAAGAAEPSSDPAAAVAPAVEVDNTARNARDREGTTRTPMDQSNAPEDLAITQHIRKTVVGNDQLSSDAHNVKIITVDGVVTLRGPVDSEDERAFIVATAKGAPQVKRVDDQLDVDDGAAGEPPAVR